MAGIQTRIADNRGGFRELTVHDPEYWEGPYSHQPYPKALYRQTQPGQPCETRVVTNADEQARLGSEWWESPAGAQQAFEALEADIAKAAAHRHFEDQRLSAKAIAEALHADRSTDQMLPAIPETKRRGRPRKAPLEEKIDGRDT